MKFLDFVMNVTPILDVSRKSSKCDNLVLDTLKFTTIKTSNEYYTSTRVRTK
jgi:hypothetical protein